MTKNPKQSTIDAINKFSQKQLDESKPPESRAHYEKPEKDVETECLKWMRSKGWTVQIFEAKATYSPAAGQWLQQGMKAGTCDCLGSDADGTAVAVEFKAKGRLSSFNKESNYAQRKFLVDRITGNNFACVTDSADRLEIIYNRWYVLRLTDKHEARRYLVSMLPQAKKKSSDDDPLFED